MRWQKRMGVRLTRRIYKDHFQKPKCPHLQKIKTKNNNQLQPLIFNWLKAKGHRTQNKIKQVFPPSKLFVEQFFVSSLQSQDGQPLIILIST